MLVAGAVVDRHPLERPGVLRIEPGVNMKQVAARDGRVQNLRRAGDTVDEGGTDVAVGPVSAAISAEGVLYADLDVVRAGDVRDRPSKREAVRIPAVCLAQRVPLRAERRVRLVDLRVPLGRPARLLDPRLHHDVVALVVGREAPLHQHAVRHG